MSTIKVDTITTRTGSGNITVSNTTAGTSASFSSDLFVGKTASDFDGGVFEATSGGTFVSRSGTPFGVNRNGSFNQLIKFYKDGADVWHYQN